jgi:hypothetical protein
MVSLFTGRFIYLYYMTITKPIAILLLMWIIVSCKEEQQGVPPAFVDLRIYLSDPQNIELTNIGGWKYFSGGYRGVLVYRKSQNEFMAYDRACPYKVEEPTSLIVVDTTNNIIAVDESCGSKFQLLDGSTLQTPALVPLKQYRTVFDGTMVRVTN